MSTTSGGCLTYISLLARADCQYLFTLPPNGARGMIAYPSATFTYTFSAAFSSTNSRIISA